MSNVLAKGVMFSILKCVDPRAFCGTSTQDREVDEHSSSKTLFIRCQFTLHALSTSGVFSFKQQRLIYTKLSQIIKLN